MIASHPPLFLIWTIWIVSPITAVVLLWRSISYNMFCVYHCKTEANWSDDQTITAIKHHFLTHAYLMTCSKERAAHLAFCCVLLCCNSVKFTLRQRFRCKLQNHSLKCTLLIFLLDWNTWHFVLDNIISHLVLKWPCELIRISRQITSWGHSCSLEFSRSPDSCKNASELNWHS